MAATGCQSLQKPRGLPDGDYKNGDFLMTLKQGHYKDLGFEEGSYTVTGDKISFRVDKFDFSGDTACGLSTLTYTYQWTFDTKAGLLTLKPVADDCKPRQDANTTGTWAYSKPKQ
jgi:hypothetical protein